MEVIDRVRDVKNHELHDETPQSYLSHYALYECLCECGKRKLISESALAQGRIKSCGCLKRQKKQIAWEKKNADIDLRSKRREIVTQIKNLQIKLAHLQIAIVRDERAIEQVGVELKSLFAKKAYLSRNIVKKRSKKELEADMQKEIQSWKQDAINAAKLAAQKRSVNTDT